MRNGEYFYLYIFYYSHHGQVKGKEFTTLDRPLNHKVFDPSMPKVNPILQHHLDAQNQKNMPALAPAPIINVSFGQKFINMQGGAHARAEPTTAPKTPLCSLPCSMYNLQCPTLLLANHITGVNMPIADFCATYNLMQPIQEKLARMVTFSSFASSPSTSSSR